jgi:hypothetical protein
MALTVIATAGAANANSYITVAEADAFMAQNFYAAAWEDVEADAKAQLVITATRMLDEQYEWLGIINSTTQALRWPRGWVLDRDGAKYLDSTTIPTFLKNATAEMARMLSLKDRQQTLDDATSGITSVTAGSVSVEFDKTDRIEVVPSSVEAMVRPYCTLGVYGKGSVPLVRV